MQSNNIISNINNNSFLDNLENKNLTVNESPKLPPEILELIFSGIPNRNDMDIQLINGVNKSWCKTSIDLIKHQESKAINSFVDFLLKNLGQTKCDDDDTLKNLDDLTKAVEEKRIQNSDNLKAIKASSTNLQKKIVMLLENLCRGDYNPLEKNFLSKENKSKFDTNLFALATLNIDIRGAISSADVIHHIGSRLCKFATKLAKIKQYDKAIDLAKSIFILDESYVQSNIAFMNIIYKLLEDNLIVKAIKTHDLMYDTILKDSVFNSIFENLKLNGRIEKIKEVADVTIDTSYKQRLLDLLKILESKSTH